MPHYEYRCENCGHQFDIFQQMREERLKTCPQCNQDRLTRLLSAGGGLIFKGSGFYITDYKSNPKSDDKRGAEAKPPAAGEQTGDKSGSTTSDAKKSGPANGESGKSTAAAKKE